jgi:hypothetical protein
MWLKMGVSREMLRTCPDLSHDLVQVSSFATRMKMIAGALTELSAGKSNQERTTSWRYRQAAQRSAATSHRGLCNHLRRGHILNTIKIPSLRDIPVLAEFAGQVAAGSSKRQDRRTRQKVIERFLFNRIDAEAR